MPVTLKSFFTNLAKKAGMDPESDAVKGFFSTLPDTEVPEDVQKGVDNSLISLTDAKNNHPEIKNYYQKQSLDSVDKTLSDLLDEFDLDEVDKQAILAERSTYKRVPLATKKIAELQAKKAGAGTNKDKAEIQKEIDALHRQIAAEKEGRTAEKTQYEQALQNIKIQAKIDAILGGFKTIHDDMDPEIKGTVLQTVINKALQDNNAKFGLDEQGRTVLVKNDGTNFYGENHQQILPSQFIEQQLAKTKLLKVSSGQSNGATQQSAQHQQPQSSGDGKNQQSNASLVDRNKQALVEYENSLKIGQF